MRIDFGAEYVLSPSGVVDLGTVRTPASFNTDGTARSYREVNNWKGPDTDKRVFTGCEYGHGWHE